MDSDDGLSCGSMQVDMILSFTLNSNVEFCGTDHGRQPRTQESLQVVKMEYTDI